MEWGRSCRPSLRQWGRALQPSRKPFLSQTGPTCLPRGHRRPDSSGWERAPTQASCLLSPPCPEDSRVCRAPWACPHLYRIKCFVY